MKIFFASGNPISPYKVCDVRTHELEWEHKTMKTNNMLDLCENISQFWIYTIQWLISAMGFGTPASSAPPAFGQSFATTNTTSNFGQTG